MTSESHFGTYFEAFNAKHQTPHEVAENYIYSKHLSDLCGPYHAVLVGPRGSGKTTLLKMLQPAALTAWQGSRAKILRANIDYSAVFISSDISWSRQLNSLGYGKLSDDNHRTLIVACFTTHVLHALIQTMIQRCAATTTFRGVALSLKQESKLSLLILNELQLSDAIPSLSSIRQALRSRLSDIRTLANQGSLIEQTEFRTILASKRFLHIDFLDMCSNLAGLFDDTVNEIGAKWALLFDELETAPDWVVQQLFSAFRVSDPKLYLKLAISPASPAAYETLTSALSPADWQDHKQIPLWYQDRTTAEKFCNDLWNSLAEKQGIKLSARESLGPSAFAPASGGGDSVSTNPYGPGGYWVLQFQELQRKDKSFAAFLRAHGVDVSQLGLTDRFQKDAVLRKAAPVAAVRNFFLHEDREGGVSPRLRKTSSLYAGAESIFVISEGNPRWLIGMLSPLIAHMVDSKVKRVDVSVQAEQIDKAAERLIALLRTTPLPGGTARESSFGLDALLESIARRLHWELVQGRFSIDPKFSFVADRDYASEICELLAAGLNRGAVVLVDEKTSRPIVGDLHGVPLRLSYLLAAKFGLALRKGKTTGLRQLLTSGDRGGGVDASRQLGLL